jgi:pimeloyl-ACP methyl ester carboxylesterase
VLPDRVRPRTIKTSRGQFAALEAMPDRGVCERKPALLLPGYTGSKEDFLPVLPPLAAAGRRVIAIDQRGQYESEPSAEPGDYRPDALASDVLAVARQVADDDAGVHLLGHSFGGLVARQAVLAEPAAPLSLTLLGSGPGSLPGARAARLRAMLERLGTAAGPAGPDPQQLDPQQLDPQRLAAGIRQLWDERLGPDAAADGVPPHILAFLRRRTLRNSPVGMVMMARYLLDWPDQTAELASRDELRILVLFGELDDAWPTPVQAAMARRLRAQRACIPGAAHSPAVEAPATTASMLTGFWNEAERDARARRRAAGGATGRP